MWNGDLVTTMSNFTAGYYLCLTGLPADMSSNQIRPFNRQPNNGLWTCFITSIWAYFAPKDVGEREFYTHLMVAYICYFHENIFLMSSWNPVLNSWISFCYRQRWAILKIHIIDFVKIMAIHKLFPGLHWMLFFYLFQLKSSSACTQSHQWTGNYVGKDCDGLVLC